MLMFYFWTTYLGTISTICFVIYDCWRSESSWSIATWKRFPTFCVLVASLCPILNIPIMALLAYTWLEPQPKETMTLRISLLEDEEDE